MDSDAYNKHKKIYGDLIKIYKKMILTYPPNVLLFANNKDSILNIRKNRVYFNSLFCTDKDLLTSFIEKYFNTVRFNLMFLNERKNAVKQLTEFMTYNMHMIGYSIKEYIKIRKWLIENLTYSDDILKVKILK